MVNSIALFLMMGVILVVMGSPVSVLQLIVLQEKFQRLIVMGFR